MGLDYCTELVENVVCIDTGYSRKRMVAAYLIREHGRAAIIDSGTYNCVPRFLESLDYYGIAPANVDYVIPTHVHLDHAGGSGDAELHATGAEQGGSRFFEFAVVHERRGAGSGKPHRDVRKDGDRDSAGLWTHGDVRAGVPHHVGGRAGESGIDGTRVFPYRSRRR